MNGPYGSKNGPQSSARGRAIAPRYVRDSG
jgi:hypothetical protein